MGKNQPSALFIVSGIVCRFLVCLLINQGCWAAQAPESVPSLFAQQQITIGIALPQTVLSGFILGESAADLVTLAVDESSRRHLRVVSLAGEMKAEAILRSELQFVDIAMSTSIHTKYLERSLFKTLRVTWVMTCELIHQASPTDADRIIALISR
jgi:hypothetical protein